MFNYHQISNYLGLCNVNVVYCRFLELASLAPCLSAAHRTVLLPLYRVSLQPTGQSYFPCTVLQCSPPDSHGSRLTFDIAVVTVRVKHSQCFLQQKPKPQESSHCMPHSYGNMRGLPQFLMECQFLRHTQSGRKQVGVDYNKQQNVDCSLACLKLGCTHKAKNAG